MSDKKTATKKSAKKATPKKKAVGSKPKADEGEQLQLIDVLPQNIGKIKQAAVAYKKAQKERMRYGADEQKHKDFLLAVVKEANVKMVDGAFRLKVDGFEIVVTPRDELVKVKYEKEGDQL